MVLQQHQNLLLIMECTVYRILITGYIDNELSDDEMHQLKSHLQTCGGCVAHLRKMERMQTVLKRYHLVQEVPETSRNFARNISRILQETTPAESRPAFLERVVSRYRAFVRRLVERWIASLRARPVTWVTSVSCLLILMAGVVFMDMTHTIQQPPRYALLLPDQNPIATAPQPVTITEYRDDRQNRPEASPILEAAVEDDAGLPDFIQFSDEAVVQIAKTHSEPVASYVYSHIVEASQEQLLDNAMFASYVQDALFQ